MRVGVQQHLLADAKIEGGVQAVADMQQVAGLDGAGDAAVLLKIEGARQLEQAPLDADGRRGLESGLQVVDADGQPLAPGRASAAQRGPMRQRHLVGEQQIGMHAVIQKLERLPVHPQVVNLEPRSPPVDDRQALEAEG